MKTQNQDTQSNQRGSKKSMQEEPWIVYDRVPDQLEIVVRGICGAFLGLFLTFWIWRIWDGWAVLHIVVFASALTVICAWLAAKKGDAFWYQVGKFIRWS
jgi:hypothetical protein